MIGFIGLGAMGAAMARLLVEAGHELVVHDVRPHAADELVALGATRAESPAEVADRSEIVIASLPSPAISVEVAEAVREGGAVRLFVELSTIGEAAARRCAELLAANGIGYLDAPVSGGVRGAVKGTLTVMVAGEATRIEAARPLLEVIGGTLIPVGDRPGQAQVVKLANNILSANAIVASAEAVLLAVKAGIDPRIVIDVLAHSTGRNSAVEDKLAQFVLPRTFDSQYRLDLIAKDVRLCLAAAGDLRVPMFVGRQVEELFALAESRIGGAGDSLDVIRVLEEWAGVRIDDESWKTEGAGA